MIYDDILMHFGVGALDGAPGRGSGRYPLGSGDNPNQHGAVSFESRYDKLKKQGLKEKDIAKALGCVNDKGEGNTTILRVNIQMAKHEARAMRVAEAKRLKDEGYSLQKIADKMGYKNDSSVRSLLNDEVAARKDAAMGYAEFLKKTVDQKGMIEIGAGVERELGMSPQKMKEALYMLKLEGYNTYGGRVPQATNPGRMTTYTVLTPPGTKHSEIFDTSKVNSVTDYRARVDENGKDFFTKKFHYPESMDSSRIHVVYKEDGGEDRDGLIGIRRNVQDLSLGGSHYAQIRILVDGKSYIKGMAAYREDKEFPPGKDVIIYSNKKRGTPLHDGVLKPITNDPDNPFGSLIKEKGGQSWYTGKDGKKHLSLINKRSDEGDWNEWADKLPAQFLSKQSRQLAKQQLELTKASKRAEFDEIMRLENPTLKKNLLQSFADDCDSNAVKLKAMRLPGQKYKVMLPLTSIKDNECYLPSIKDGTTVALIRYPHGGTFEIPVLKVNNKNLEGKKMITNESQDAIGIKKKVADQLSGADFDGDTVMVIPITRKVKIDSRPPLEGLKDFDTKMNYPPIKDEKGEIISQVMPKSNLQRQMGEISNLLTDMTLKGASEDEIVMAVKHSMVVVDAPKHKLDFKRSEKENHIKELKKRYQAHVDEDGTVRYGASTLISGARGQKSVVKRQGSPIINKDGSLSWKTADDAVWVDKEGKEHTRHQKSTRMAETKDARTLISDYKTPMEYLYADFANYQKSLANESRKAMIATKDIPYSASAKKAYQSEYDSLKSKLMLAEANRPKERMAQIITNSRVEAKKAADPDLTKKELKKIGQQELSKARLEVGAARQPIEVNEREYKAIQSGAISPNMLNRILRYADKDKLKQMAMPREQSGFSSPQVSQIKALLNAGYTLAEVGERFHVSASTISRAIKS